MGLGRDRVRQGRGQAGAGSGTVRDPRAALQHERLVFLPSLKADRSG